MLAQPLIPIKLEYRVRIGGSFPTGHASLELGKYRLELLPRVDAEGADAALHFSDPVTSGASSPDEEAKIVLRILSLALNTTLLITGHSTNGLDIQSVKSSELVQIAEESCALDYKEIIENAASLQKAVAVRFIRASNAYSLAISAQDLDIALSFLLLVISIEALSSMPEIIPKESIPMRHSTERFCAFLHRFSNEVDPMDTASAAEFKEKLKTIYHRYRSAFVHSGKEASIASSIADIHDVDSIAHFVDGEEVKAPSLKWFFRVCRHGLLGFLEKFPKTNKPQIELFAEIALAKNTLVVKFVSE